MSACFSLCHLDFQKLPLDRRVSQALNGDLYFSNVLPEDSRPDYICYARFPHTQTIQQKQPISVTVLNSKFRHWTELLNWTDISFPHILRCFQVVLPAQKYLALDSFLCCFSCILPLLSATAMQHFYSNAILFCSYDALSQANAFLSWFCMLLIFCYITVETMNETVAALHNITDFYSGECCCFIPIQPPQCEPSLPLLPGIYLETWPEHPPLWLTLRVLTLTWSVKENALTWMHDANFHDQTEVFVMYVNKIINLFWMICRACITTQVS